LTESFLFDISGVGIDNMENFEAALFLTSYQV
jgi:hypothetical protein